MGRLFGRRTSSFPPSFRSQTGRRLAGIDLVGRVPCRAALHDTPCDPAPFGDLAVVGAHPVDWNRCQSPLLATAGEAEPARAELGGYRAACPELRASVSHHPLLDQKDRVFNR